MYRKSPFARIGLECGLCLCFLLQPVVTQAVTNSRHVSAGNTEKSGKSKLRSKVMVFVLRVSSKGELGCSELAGQRRVGNQLTGFHPCM